MTIQIITDSTAYIPRELLEQYHIQVVSLSVHLAGKVSEEINMNHQAFFEELGRTDQWATSSQPAIEQFVSLFESYTLEQKTVLGIFLSSEMSGTYQTAALARKMVLEKNPQASIHLIDSRTNCMQMGFAVLEAGRAITEGLSLEEILPRVSGFIRKSRFLFAPLTLDYLKKGGRIGGAAAFLGAMLRIIPILTVEAGKTAVVTKVRTQPKAVTTMIQTLLKDFHRFGAGQLAVHHINDEAAGNALAQQLKQHLRREVPVIPIGPVIGLHVGPGTLGIAYSTLEDRLPE